MRYRELMLLLFISFIAAPSIFCGESLLVEDTQVLLRIPAPLFHREKGGWSGPRYAASVQASANGISVDGRDDWLTAGFPNLVSRTVWRINQDSESNTTTVDLKDKGLTPIRLTIV